MSKVDWGMWDALVGEVPDAALAALISEVQPDDPITAKAVTFRRIRLDRSGHQRTLVKHQYTLDAEQVALIERINAARVERGRASSKSEVARDALMLLEVLELLDQAYVAYLARCTVMPAHTAVTLRHFTLTIISHYLGEYIETTGLPVSDTLKARVAALPYDMMKDLGQADA